MGLMSRENRPYNIYFSILIVNVGFKPLLFVLLVSHVVSHVPQDNKHLASFVIASAVSYILQVLI